VELGVKFTSSVNGMISGIRFYKSSANTGTHIGNLWSIGGANLATATFTSETASGWQQVNFSSPVPITAGVVYVASYFTTVSHFSVNLNFFATTGVSNPPLQFLASGVSGGNGVYTYSSMSTFPSSTFEAANYWVDVVFAPTTTSPLMSIAVTPNNSSSPTVNVGASLQLAAIGTYQDNSTQDISTQVTWSSTNPAAATVLGSGLATGQGVGTAVILAALSGIPSNTVTLTVQAAPPSSCPCTIWSNSAVPSLIDSGPGGAVEVGVKFTADTSGMVTGIRFYKSSMNTGTHIGNLWSSTGTNLATVTFTSETASGWQQANFSSPVAITAGTTYVASYHTNVSHFSVDLNAFATAGVDNPPLHALATGPSGGDGVYLYHGTSAFPTNTYNAANYWVDVVFVEAPPPVQTCPCTIWSSTAVPTIIDDGAGGAVELGVKFRADSDGMITGIRFYKSSMNTGAHVGNLWSSTGTNLATATFTSETASGWQQVDFSSPVPITAGVVYVASYFTTVSHFSIDLNAFATVGVDNPPLHALANGVSGGDGVYLYSSTSVFPTSTYNAANYWVDVVFIP
jgi:hypothetical protein